MPTLSMVILTCRRLVKVTSIFGHISLTLVNLDGDGGLVMLLWVVGMVGMVVFLFIS